MQMWIYIVRRVLLLIPVIIGVMTVTWGLVFFVPVSEKLYSFYGPSRVGYSPTVSCAALNLPGSGQCPNPAYQRGIAALGLNQPPWVQWGHYIFNSLTLNWGSTDVGSNAAKSLSLGALPVTTVLSYFLPYTLELSALSLALILALAIPLGNYSAVYRNRPIDQGARLMSFSGFAIPGFLLGSLLLLGVVSLTSGGTYCGGASDAYNNWYGSWPQGVCFPGSHLPSWVGMHQQTSPTGFITIDSLIHGDWSEAIDSVRRMILPAFVIAFGSIAAILRFVRNSMLEVMNLDFVRTARAKGVPERQVVRRHAGRNSLNVTVTVLGLTFAGFIGGFPIIEYVFHLNGIGLLLAYSIQPAYDFGLIFGTTLLFTIIVVLANIVVDILYAYLDPRVRLG